MILDIMNLIQLCFPIKDKQYINFVKGLSTKVSKMNLGEHSYIGGGLNVRRWTSNEAITCGKFCSIASNLAMYVAGDHKYDTFSTYPFKERFGFNCPANCCGKGAPKI